MVDRILAVAERFGARLICAGTTGPHPLNPLALGSVAHGLVTESHRDLLLVREAHQLQPRRSLRTITAGVDGSPESLRAAALAAGLAWRLDAGLQLVHVRDAETSSIDREAMLARLVADARRDGVRATWSLMDGEVADCLDAAAGSELGGALVVGRGRFGLRSVTNRLLRTTWLPVFVAAGRDGLPLLG